ncbi:MAG: DUF916 domain-containing protein [Microbacteriaceae bacterium]|nr:DUF916 domain-containing protein [Microbacteriaceae bacterium]
MTRRPRRRFAAGAPIFGVPRGEGFRARLAGAVLVLILGLPGSLLTVGSTPGASAAPTPPAAPPSLGLVAIGQSAGYFAVTIAEGEAQQLQLQLTNPEPTPVQARTYAADAYTLTGGGFGTRASDAPIGAVTGWVTYPSELITLASKEVRARTFSVSVPRGTSPGEYLTAVATESGAISPAAIAAGESQIVRTSLAVSIRVPGALEPELKIGAATQQPNVSTTQLTVQLSNTGNANLKPTVRVVLRDSAGTQLAVKIDTMESVYAHTATNVQLDFPVALPPGSYTAEVHVTDKKAQLQPVDARLKLSVSGAAKTGGAKPLKAIAQQPAAPGAVIALISVPIVLAVGITLMLRRRNRRRI